MFRTDPRKREQAEKVRAMRKARARRQREALRAIRRCFWTRPFGHAYEYSTGVARCVSCPKTIPPFTVDPRSH